MTIADIQKIAAKAVADALRLTATKDAPPVEVAEQPVRKPAKRTLTAEQKQKMADGRKRAQAAKKSTAKPAPKPAAAESAKRTDDVLVKAGGVEVVAYDGGVVLRAPGRRRGIPFRKGDWKLFVAFVESIRKGEDMSRIGAAVKGQIA